jgi:hypothetical protein
MQGLLLVVPLTLAIAVRKSLQPITSEVNSILRVLCTRKTSHVGRGIDRCNIGWIAPKGLLLAFALSKETHHCCTRLQLESGSNSTIAAAVSVVVFPKSFCRRTSSWLMMNVITPELRYSAG